MHLVNLFANGNGKVVWASSDGEFEGGVIVDGKETVYNLDEWAKSKGIEEPLMKMRMKMRIQWIQTSRATL